MPLQVKLDNLEGLDESLHSLYTQTDDGYKLDLSDPENVAEVSGLSKAIKSERQLHKEAAAKLKTWQALGKTPEEIQEMLQAAEDQENSSLRNEGKLDEILAKHQQKFKEQQAALKNSHQREIDALNESLKQKQDMLNSQIRNIKLQSELSKAGVMPGYEDLAISELQRNVVLDEKANVTVVDQDGDPSPLSVSQFIAEYAKKRPALFTGSLGNGSGAQGRASNLAPNTIKYTDNNAFLDNLDEIIAGKVKIQG